MAHRTLRWPRRSPAMPSIGARRLPRYCSEANNESKTTEPVSTSTYQPRMRFSISMPQEVSKSAGHWKRKLRIRNGAKMGKRAILLMPPRFKYSAPVGRCARGSLISPIDIDAPPLDAPDGRLAGNVGAEGWATQSGRWQHHCTW